MANKTRSGSAEQVTKTACYLCHGGCVLSAHIADGKLTKLEGDPDGPYNLGAICEKALSAKQYIYSPYRLKYPLKRIGERGEGKWQRISWDEALDTIAERLQYYKNTFGAESIAYASGTARVIRESPVFGIFNGALGTPNGIGIGHYCLSKTRAPVVNMTVGRVKGPTNMAVFRDFEKCACFVAWGDTIIEARGDFMGAIGRRFMNALKRGAKLIVIDPVFTRAAQKADIWLPVRPGTDIALALAWQNIIISEGLYDKDFVKEWTNAPFLWRADTRKLLRPNDVFPKGDPKGFVVWDANSQTPKAWDIKAVSYGSLKVEAALNGTYNVVLADGKTAECKTAWQLMSDNVKEWTAERASEVTWIPVERIRESARMYATTRPASIEWGLGTSQCTRSTATNQAIMQLKAITGNLDVRGGNPFWQVPGMRGHGDAARLYGLGITPEQEAKCIRGGFAFDADAKITNIPLPGAYEPAVWKTILTGKPYPVKALYGADSNPLVGHENPGRYILEALKKLEFIVWTDITMTPSSEYADIVLPVCTPFERNWVTDTHELGIMAGQAVIEPLYESKSDFYICVELLKRWGLESMFPWQTEEEWCNWRLENLGITFRELVKTCFFPAAEIWRKYEKGLLRPDGKPGFATVSGKCELYATMLEDAGLQPLPVFTMPPQSYETTPELAKQYPLILITGSREINYPYFHSQYHYVPRLREMQPFPEMLINTETASQLDLKDGDWAWVETPKGRARFKANVTGRIHPKVVSVTHSWWYPELPGPEHGCFESSCNILVDPENGADPATGTTELRGLLCRVYRADGPPSGVPDSIKRRDK